MKKIILIYLLSTFIVASRVYAQQNLNTSDNSVTNQQLHPPPAPYFAITGLCFGDTTRFINQTPAVIWTEWFIMNDKGDTIYNNKNTDASYYFKKRGFYTVCLAAYNGHLASKTRVVRIDTITKAAFAFRYCYDQFDNLSACSDQFVWVLPDNSISTDTAPVYKFTAPGKYPVKLVAKRGNRTDTLFKYLNVKGDSLGIPNAAFTCKRIDTSATFEFTAVDSLADRYSWYFGDKQGDDSSGYKVIHRIDMTVYTPPVNLFVTNGCGLAIDVLDPFAVTAIQEEKKKNWDAILYPNPVREQINISIHNSNAGNYLIRLIDDNGSILEETTAAHPSGTIQYQYNTDQLSKGMYLLQIIAGKEVLNKRFIIQ